MSRSTRYKPFIIEYFPFIMVCILLVACCPCNDPTDVECSNYDPCHNIEPVKASFGAGYIIDLPGSDDFNSFYPDTTIYLDGDTIPGSTTFYSYSESADSFFYKVGQDPRLFTSKDFSLEFGNEYHLEPISVIHIVKGESECYENLISVDTVTRNFVISSQPFDPPNPKQFNSKYYGISTEFPNDSFEIEFKDIHRQIVNLPLGAFGNQALYRRDYDEIYFTGQEIETIWLGHVKMDLVDRKK